ncbi:MAG: UDP-N-acetylmuramoyl-L-alanyl-D-glutamate--2,6-diaminopimelate ligase [Bacteroidales bacterium]|nr:UDP-N-acetylmuramoyl-L-alanyl-D-glutamate--2,6-diaminopimelate ligase [Bacteroidales bacterium]
MNQLIKNILTGIPCKIIGDENTEIVKIEFDSRNVQKGDMFVAVRGVHVDGHEFIGKALGQGATAVLCETLPENPAKNVCFIQVENSAKALGPAVSNYFGNPSKSLRLVGVTGTNGKTSIATLLYRLFTAMGNKCGLLSTVVNKVGERDIPATHTTPDAIAIHSLMKEMADEGCTYAFMEVSSHALDQDRTAGLDYDVAIFTNLTHDHLDYHKDFDGYLKAKKKLFDNLSEEAFALVNVDDKNGKVMLQNSRAQKRTFGVKSVADFKAKVIESHFDGMLVNFDDRELWIKLIGLFNASNMLAVYAAASLLGVPKDEILRIISSLDTVDGRFEYVRSEDGVTAIVDYAHTPDALKNVLSTIREIKPEGSELISLVGAGGDRDRKKRPVMARLAAEMSEKVILTSDNPRSEDPDFIISEMFEGIDPSQYKKVLKISNRKEAIRTACMLAKQGDVILIAGKGHETYQEVKGVRSYFNDKEIVRELFAENKKK